MLKIAPHAAAVVSSPLVAPIPHASTTETLPSRTDGPTFQEAGPPVVSSPVSGPGSIAARYEVYLAQKKTRGFVARLRHNLRFLTQDSISCDAKESVLKLYMGLETDIARERSRLQELSAQALAETATALDACQREGRSYEHARSLARNGFVLRKRASALEPVLLSVQNAGKQLLSSLNSGEPLKDGAGRVVGESVAVHLMLREVRSLRQALDLPVKEKTES